MYLVQLHCLVWPTGAAGLSDGVHAELRSAQVWVGEREGRGVEGRGVEGRGEEAKGGVWCM